MITTTAIKADTGEVYSGLDDGSTAANSIIARANTFVALAMGTTTGNDAVARPLCDAMVVNQVMGGVDPVNKTIGTLSVGDKDLRTMQKYFTNEAHKAAVMKGYSLDGLRILFTDSEA